MLLMDLLENLDGLGIISLGGVRVKVVFKGISIFEEVISFGELLIERPVGTPCRMSSQELINCKSINDHLVSLLRHKLCFLENLGFLLLTDCL